MISIHQVTPEEVEEAIFEDKPISIRGRDARPLIYAQTLAGRYLFVVLSRISGAGRYKVLTAREMENKEVRYYRKKRGS